MEVVKANGGLLTDAEVRELIDDRLRERRMDEEMAQRPANPQRDEVQDDVLQYLEHCRTAEVSVEAVAECFKRLLELNLGLTEAEIVQIVNTVPRSNVEVFVTVEECMERLSEDNVNAILGVVRDTLGERFATGEEPGEEEAEEEEEDAGEAGEGGGEDGYGDAGEYVGEGEEGQEALMDHEAA